MWTITSRRRSLRQNRQGLSNLIIVVLGLVILVVIVSNVILWSYQMNQIDWERSQERTEITSVIFLRPNSVQVTFENSGPSTVHFVSLWINNSTLHYRKDIDVYVDSGQTSTYTTTFGWKSRNTYTINLITERGNMATFSTMYGSSIGAMLVYGEGSVAFPRYRLWNGVSWTAESSEGVTSATIQWVELKSCPIRNEKILAVLSSAGYLDVSVWDGSKQTWASPIRMASVGTTIDAYRLFDVTYEQNSGRGIIVYNPSATGGVDPQYRIWNGSTWSSPQTIDIATTGVIYWAKLASKPTSNEIALITLDANNDVFGMIWNGNIWSNGLLLEDTAAISTEEDIAVEYMQVSRKAMFVWGSSTSMESRVWEGTAWGSELVAVSIGATPNWFSLKADPNGDRLVLVSVDGDSDLNTVRWSGSAWTLDTEHDNSVETNAGRCADAEFETTPGHEGHIILVWGDFNTNPITYKHFDGTFWGVATQVPTSQIPTTRQQWHVLRRSGDDKILLATLDNGLDINTAYWDGVSWFWSDEVETSGSTTSMQSFDVAPDV